MKKVQSASPLINPPKKSPGPAPASVKKARDNTSLKATTPTNPQKSPHTLNKSSKPAPASVKKARSNLTSPKQETNSSPTVKKQKPAPASAMKARAETSKQSPHKKSSDRPAPACVKKARTDTDASKNPDSNKKVNDRPAPASVKKARSTDPQTPSLVKMSGNTKKALTNSPKTPNKEDEEEEEVVVVRKEDDVQCLVCDLWFYGHTVKSRWLKCVVCHKWLHVKCTQHKHHCNKCYTLMCG